jgi:putative phosphoesterase
MRVDDDRRVTAVSAAAERVAVLSDVHGNVAALGAVLSDAAAAGVDLIGFTGDLSWGPQPRAPLDIVRALETRTLFVRGNADRALIEVARGERPAKGKREAWMVRQHAPDDADFLSTFSISAVVDVVGLGRVRLCHGSPRSDVECVTPETPRDRFEQRAAGVSEAVIVTGHTHLQFDRRISDRRSVNPGSVGLPYHVGRPGTAYWALLGPDVELRQSMYDVDEAIQAAAISGDPSAQVLANLLRKPPTPAEVILDAERRQFAN